MLWFLTELKVFPQLEKLRSRNYPLNSWEKRNGVHINSYQRIIPTNQTDFNQHTSKVRGPKFQSSQNEKCPTIRRTNLPKVKNLFPTRFSIPGFPTAIASVQSYRNSAWTLTCSDRLLLLLRESIHFMGSIFLFSAYLDSGVLFPVPTFATILHPDVLSLLRVQTCNIVCTRTRVSSNNNITHVHLATCTSQLLDFVHGSDWGRNGSVFWESIFLRR